MQFYELAWLIWLVDTKTKEERRAEIWIIWQHNMGEGMGDYLSDWMCDGGRGIGNVFCPIKHKFYKFTSQLTSPSLIQEKFFVCLAYKAQLRCLILKLFKKNHFLECLNSLNPLGAESVKPWSKSESKSEVPTKGWHLNHMGNHPPFILSLKNIWDSLEPKIWEKRNGKYVYLPPWMG